MRRYGKRSARRGEIIVMTLTSVFVLSVLTVTGIYIKNRNSAQEQDGYYIDFDALEAEMNEELYQIETENDLDYTGTEEEFDYTKQNVEAVQSGSIEQETEETAENEQIVQNEVVDTPPVEEITVETQSQPDTMSTIVDNALTDSDSTISNDIITSIPPINFSENESLVWPIMGNIIINYSMDKSVYFATLDQFKYSPAIVISATEGEQITAAADGIITKIYQDNELGNVVEMDLGDGYSLTYGQLRDIVVSVGQYVTTGQLIGQAGTPTKYYSIEGCNVYFKMTKDDEPIDPTTYLE